MGMTEAATSPSVPGPMPPGRGSRPSRLVSDDRLARRAKAGDRSAFEAIYQRYHQDLYRFCLAMLGNAADAQEALQDTMVKVLRGLPGETRHIHLKAWLYRIARNESIETIRRRRDSAQIDAEEPGSASHVADTAESRERLRRLISDLEELPERQRAALVMRELGGLGFPEIAEAFETSPGVARQTVYEARLSLRQMEEGREMSCAAVMRELSDGDGRLTRRRALRAHLRNCADCRAFEESIARRHRDLAAIAPLPLALSAGLLHGVLTGQAASAGGVAGAAGGGAGAAGIAGTVGAGAGKVVATSAIVKSVATVAVVAAVGVSAADRTGVVHLGLPGGSAPATTRSPSAGGEPAPGPGSRPTSPPRVPADAPAVNAAAAARLAEELEAGGGHGRPSRAAGSHGNTTPNGAAEREQGPRPGTQLRGHGATRVAAAPGHRKVAGTHHGAGHGQGSARTPSKPHRHPHPHRQPVPHAPIPPGKAGSQAPSPGATPTAKPAEPSKPSSGANQKPPVESTAIEGETALPEG